MTEDDLIKEIARLIGSQEYGATAKAIITKVRGEAQHTAAERIFDLLDIVDKAGGNYSFCGLVVAAFEKRSDARRYVVENSDGVLHIFSGKQLLYVGKGRLKDRSLARIRAGDE